MWYRKLLIGHEIGFKTCGSQIAVPSGWTTIYNSRNITPFGSIITHSNMDQVRGAKFNGIDSIWFNYITGSEFW